VGPGHGAQDGRRAYGARQGDARARLPGGRRVALLGTLGLTAAQLATIAGMLPGDAPKVAPKREFAPVKAARERAEAAACKTCRDFGVVRIAPRDNGDVHFRTPNGATGATAIGRSKPCEARGCKAGKAARKARKAA
jgi:hypothetical protein